MEIHHSELLLSSWLRGILRATLISSLVVDTGREFMHPAIPTRWISLVDRSRAILRKLDTSIVSSSFDSFFLLTRLIRPSLKELRRSNDPSKWQFRAYDSRAYDEYVACTVFRCQWTTGKSSANQCTGPSNPAEDS